MLCCEMSQTFPENKKKKEKSEKTNLISSANRQTDNHVISLLGWT